MPSIYTGDYYHNNEDNDDNMRIIIIIILNHTFIFHEDNDGIQDIQWVGFNGIFM